MKEIQKEKFNIMKGHPRRLPQKIGYFSTGVNFDYYIQKELLIDSSNFYNSK